MFICAWTSCMSCVHVYSPHVREPKTVLILDSPYWILDSLSVELRFQIPIIWEVLDFLSFLQMSKPRIWIPQAKVPRFRDWNNLPSMLFPLLQESPSKRRKKAKKAKPLQLIIPNEVTATETGCDKQLKLTDRVKPIVDYVRKTLYELKVSTSLCLVIPAQNWTLFILTRG